ncbi:hypothetical protein BKA70DRAFT_1256885 [Coprinopsis sp. MPI-PUGE-AT-0042]|nr:hypothetical protein BKA70DRAFT_1256885 [Coprinopsis sp. MPI-PUGE-AT-0042]
MLWFRGVVCSGTTAAPCGFGGAFGLPFGVLGAWYPPPRERKLKGLCGGRAPSRRRHKGNPCGLTLLIFQLEFLQEHRKHAL